MNADLLARVRFFLEHGGYCTPPGPVACALKKARVEIRNLTEGLEVTWEDEIESWDGETPAPRYVMWARVKGADGDTLASLGMIGVNSLRDPYMRVVEAELLGEAFAKMDEERDRGE